MLLHAEVALRRVFELDSQIGPVTVLDIVRVEIAIEPRDLVLA